MFKNQNTDSGLTIDEVITFIYFKDIYLPYQLSTIACTIETQSITPPVPINNEYRSYRNQYLCYKLMLNLYYYRITVILI